jgi:lysozyme
MLNPRGKRILKVHEGLRLDPYKDSLGYWTICVGHLIDARKGARPPAMIPATEAYCATLFDQDVAAMERALLRVNPWVAQLDPVRYAVLVDMTFNLGTEPFDDDGFKDWPIFEGQVKSGKYKEAADNMRKTTWANQVGRRAARLALMMETGTWPPDIL